MVNALVRWATRYTDLALAQLRRVGGAVREEDVARRSPLAREHINVHGRDTFALAEPLARGPSARGTIPRWTARRRARGGVFRLLVPLLLKP